VSETLRLDKWLWRARFFKTRALAAGSLAKGGFRLNGRPIGKAHQGVGIGDVLTFPLGPKIVTVRVLGLGERRGPASEARALYDAPDATMPPKFEG